MKFNEAEKIVTPHIHTVEESDANGKPITVQKVFLYPQGRQFGGKNRVEPVAFPLRIAIHNVAAGGWNLTPNLKDEKTVLTVIEKAQTEFAEKDAEKNRRIAELEAQLEEAKGNKKTAKV